MAPRSGEPRGTPHGFGAQLLIWENRGQTAAANVCVTNMVSPSKKQVGPEVSSLEASPDQNHPKPMPIPC